MKPSSFLAALSTSLLFCASNLTFAADTAAEPSKAAPAKASPAPQAKAKQAAAIKLVNINGATKAELKQLPGVGDAEADKIIAGRPYGSKAWLTTRNVIPPALYDGIKARIVAKQTKAITDQIISRQK